MRAYVFYIDISPSAYPRLQNKIDEACSSNGIGDGRIPYQATGGLVFLLAATKELARLMAVNCLALPHNSPQEGLTVNRKYSSFISIGYQISISPMAQDYDLAIHRADAKESKLDRWLENEANARQMERLPARFGGNAPRACLGKNLALVNSLPSRSLYTLWLSVSRLKSNGS
jgi:hypothetical protein